MKICLDTNIFISIKNKEGDAMFCEIILDAIDEKSITAAVSTIVIAEVLVGFYKNNEIKEADRFLSTAMLKYEIMPVNIEISKKAAEIRGSSKIKLPDALIIASVVISRAEIFVTKNISLEKRNEFQILDPKNFVENYLYK